MKRSKNKLSVFFFVCVTILFAANAGFAEGSVQSRIKNCINSYEDGNYQKVIDSLNIIMPLIADVNDAMTAYKYLGISYAMLDKTDKAKASFQKGLEKFPQMTIDSLEVPPSIYIIFRQSKLEKTIAKTDTVTIIKTELVQQKPKPVSPWAIVSLVGSIGAGGAGGYVLYKGYGFYKEYHNATGDKINYYWDKSVNYNIGGGVCVGAAAILLTYSLYLFNKKVPDKSNMSVILIDGTPSLALSF